VPQTLLLADDSVTIQRVIELTFADEDIDVVAVSDGDQAIARLDAVPPDIVLVDVGMPGKTGYEVAAYMKQSPRLSHIPVVLLTGAFEPVDAARAAGSGCDGVLAKPFEPQQVIGRVKELLGRPVRPIGSLEGVFGAQPGGVQVPESGAKSIDDYFDQLDAAFSNLSGRPAPVAESSAPLAVDWFGLKPAASASAPEAQTPASDALDQLWGRTQEPTPAPSVPLPPPPVAPAAEALASRAETEKPESHTSAPPPALVTPVATAVSADLAITDDLVDRVSRRVLEQLTDRAVRETVATLAERLIREEIERIKASIE
jgi:CheY-like chemotaxis protein